MFLWGTSGLLVFISSGSTSGFLKIKISRGVRKYPVVLANISKIATPEYPRVFARKYLEVSRGTGQKNDLNYGLW